MNQFTTSQLEVIRDLAGCYWDAHQQEFYAHFPPGARASMRENYIKAITDGLSDERYWELNI